MVLVLLALLCVCVCVLLLLLNANNRCVDENEYTHVQIQRWTHVQIIGGSFCCRCRCCCAGGVKASFEMV
jgi:hypothetical protein